MYPTKVEILETEHKFKPAVLRLVKEWKRDIWKDAKATNDSQCIALRMLVTMLGKVYDKPVNIEFVKGAPTSWYSPKYKTIYLTNPYSIISALHELAHHLFGANELKACHWSVWLFKKTFPQAFHKLKWEGHMLKKV